jgi:hypothetical protein
VPTSPQRGSTHEELTMPMSFLLGAPPWVWGLLAALIALGVSQSLPRAVSLRRAAAMPVAMVVLSLYGVATGFPTQPLALAAWAAGLAGALWTARATGAWAGMRWSALERRVLVPGSWWPMLLMLAIFATKFAVGAMRAGQLAAAQEPLFAVAVGLACGGASGAFLARGLAMWKVARSGLAMLA